MYMSLYNSCMQRQCSICFDGKNEVFGEILHQNLHHIQMSRITRCIEGGDTTVCIRTAIHVVGEEKVHDICIPTNTGTM